MPIINDNYKSDTDEIQLWHAPMSSCSQRVRILLNYHNIKFKNHLIKLDKAEHASKTFLKINPEGLVPVIADGPKLINESNDIIKYIDEKYGYSLLSSNIEKEKIATFLKEIDNTQNSLKLCTFNFLFKSTTRMNEQEYNFFKANHSNKSLVRFYSDFNNGFDQEKIVNAVNYTKRFFDMVENQINLKSNSIFQNGFSLADVSLIPNVHRFSLMGWPFIKYPKIYTWYKMIREKKWFVKAIVEWEPPNLISSFKNYVNNSTSISSFL